EEHDTCDRRKHQPAQPAWRVGWRAEGDGAGRHAGMTWRTECADYQRDPSPCMDRTRGVDGTTPVGSQTSTAAACSRVLAKRTCGQRSCASCRFTRVGAM